VRRRLRRLGAVIGTLPREITITLVVTLVVTVTAPPLLLLLTKHKVPVWVAVLAFGVAFLVGIVFGTTAGGTTEDESCDQRSVTWSRVRICWGPTRLTLSMYAMRSHSCAGGLKENCRASRSATSSRLGSSSPPTSSSCATIRTQREGTYASQSCGRSGTIS
jgi:hypothetical protein